ncbi:MAG: sulfite exporter TauE/SafE family protein, partial [Pseudomonadota bacterium]|nr:sulfite exporter TauE/SafE family protein [Pseudomonadota bacterium]MEC7234591.1 sulfite exporter TauE/SafE family protein [Pseudomonadota bacterium]
AAVPWLLLFATLLFMLGGQLERLAARTSARQLWIIGALALFLTCIYGGYFNGGFGILTLAALSLAGYTQVRTMQGLKLIFATVSSISALVLFIGAGVVDYVGGLAVMAGIGLGSYGAARLTDYVSDKTVRHISLAICIGVTAYAFYVEYG